MSTGVLLINLGTPDAPTPDAVGRYLRQFLMDPFVIDTPAPLRWLLVNVAIVPRRKYQSASAYQTVQLPEGSPLLVHTRALTHEVAQRLNSSGENYAVEFGMRYGNPPIKSALKVLKSRGVSRIIVLPLYPQYAESSFETAVFEALARRGIKRIAVACPSFVCDCLETLEEMGMRGRKTFIAAGGESFQLIPSLNADATWAETIAKWIAANVNQHSVAATQKNA